MNPMRKLILIGVVGIIGMILGFQCVNYKMVRGNELGVKETWQGGVEDKVYQPGLHWLTPAWSQKIYSYDASSQIFVMNNNVSPEEKGQGRATDAYLVQSQEGQDMTISMNIRWRLDPAKLVSLHKTVRQDIEEKLIRPVVMRVVKDEATKMKALDAYSGEGLVTLQQNIQNALQGKGADQASAELPARGVMVENFVIEHITLDPKYIEEIKGKQVAVQRQLRAVEEQRASEAEALVAKAKAQADANTQIVAADRDKQVTVLKAEADNQRAIIAAKAEQQKRVLEAEGKRDADIAEAKGIIARGEAEAEANKLKLQSYAVPGAEIFARIEIAKQVAPAFSGVKGWLPQDMKVNLLTANFMDSVEQMMKGVATATPLINMPLTMPNNLINSTK